MSEPVKFMTMTESTARETDEQGRVVSETTTTVVRITWKHPAGSLMDGAAP